MANDNETVEQLCEKLQNQSLYNDAIEDDAWAFITDMSSKIEEAHKREVEALKWKVENYAQVVAAKEREIAKRDALIKELYDAINKYRKEDCPSCDMKRKAECVLRNRPCAKYKKHRALSLRAAEVLGLIDSAQEIINDLAKAREVVK